MALYKSSEDYLEAILMISSQQGYCKSVDVAKKLCFSKASVSIAVTKLEAEGYITRNADGVISLTESGNMIAEKTLDKHCFLKNFFSAIGVDEKTAEEDACNIEHAISDITFEKLKKWAEKTAHSKMCS